MSYTTRYDDGNGNYRNITITDDDSVEALKNDYEEVMRTYNPSFVRIERVKANAGEAMHLKVTVTAPSHYLESQSDASPKACDSMTVNIIAKPGYPLTALSASYSSSHYLASPNVFRSGEACIDNWIPFSSSLITVVEKLVRDMIHDPSVTRYDSMANSGLEDWHKNGVSSGIFPTIDPKLLYAVKLRALPPRRVKVTPPPLPRKRADH